MNGKRATNIEHAWINFDPEMPLPGDDHPFYVRRPGEPTQRLTNELRLAAQRPASPKLLFTGYRGAGKSTELNRVARDERLRRYYWIVRFSVKETGDIQNMDYRDVLLALGAKIYTQYTESGGKLDPDLIAELETWKDRTVERLRSKGAVFETGAGFDLSRFFLATLLKVKTEHKTRELIREEIGPRLSELLEQINLIAAGIQAREKRRVLVLIDDLDKLNLENARRLFYDHWASLSQPSCAIVYTIPAALLYEDVFMVGDMFQTTFFLPNVRLRSHADRRMKDEEGYRFFRTLISKRMDETLIEEAARDELIALSGGVPADLVFAVQSALSNALHRQGNKVTKEDVAWARSQLRNPLLRLLSDEDLKVLRDIRRRNPDRLPDPRKHARLVHIRAALQYANDLDWFDTHPVLEEMLT